MYIHYTLIENYHNDGEDSDDRYRYRGTFDCELKDEMFAMYIDPIMPSPKAPFSYTESRGFEIKWVPENDDVVFVVFECYSDGDTFHNVERTYTPCGVFKTEQEALRYTGNHDNKRNGYFDRHISWLIKEVKVITK